MSVAAGLLGRLAAMSMGAALVFACSAGEPPNGDHWEQPETLPSVVESSTIIVRARARGAFTQRPGVFQREGVAGRETVVDQEFELLGVYRGPTPERKFDVHNVVRRRVFEPAQGEPGTVVFDRPEFELGVEYILFLREVEVGYPAAFYWRGPVAAVRVDGERLEWIAPDSYPEAFGDGAFGPSFDVTLAELEASLGPARAP